MADTMFRPGVPPHIGQSSDGAAEARPRGMLAAAIRARLEESRSRIEDASVFTPRE